MFEVGKSRLRMAGWTTERHRHFASRNGRGAFRALYLSAVDCEAQHPARAEIWIALKLFQRHGAPSQWRLASGWLRAERRQRQRQRQDRERDCRQDVFAGKLPANEEDQE